MEGHMEQAGDATALTDDVGFLLSRASGLVVRASNASLAGHGLRVRSYSVLLLAGDTEEGVSQREMADVLGLDPSQVVLLVDELAAAGLVERRPSPVDRRTRLVTATDAGRAVRARAGVDVDATMTRQLAELTAGEQHLLRELLTRLVAGGRGAVRV
ncbi:MAG: Transcriptional regulator, MarR family [Modestobacter sp.]|jgi:DNA-binding MarR family transcriptional regulator|nr:Transcriptional regulator, MarR family [Modestobacter sp.]